MEPPPIESYDANGRDQLDTTDYSETFREKMSGYEEMYSMQSRPALGSSFTISKEAAIAQLPCTAMGSFSHSRASALGSKSSIWATV